MSHVAAAAWKGDLTRVRVLLEEGCPVDKGACELAASGGHADVLAFLLDRGVPAGNAMAYAVEAGSAPCLDALYARGTPLTEAALKWAARGETKPDVRTWVQERVVAPEVWSRGLQHSLERLVEAGHINEQAYLELSRVAMQCHQLCRLCHSC